MADRVTRPTIAIVGAGAAGIAMGILLRRAGYEDFTIFERSSGVGGTWHDNRYPGAGCDVPSYLYCFSFEPRIWHQKFALQPEIEAYLVHCVDKYGLAPHLRLDTEIASARFDPERGRWTIHTTAGAVHEADVLISGVGQLNRPHVPAVPGLADFAGVQFHSSTWRRDHDLAGKHVAVIGSGASAVQLVPPIAAVARKVTLFQRSPGYVVPRNDRVYRRWERWMLAHVPLVRRMYRSWIYWSLEARFGALTPGSLLGRLTTWMALRHMRAEIADPALRQKLTPDYPIGCKRILISDDWYQALARGNVLVVTAGIDRVTATGIASRDGVVHPADTIVLATGFETTSFLAPMTIVGRDGRSLAEVWRAGAEAHHGITVAGFPNLFLLYGPNTNLGHNSILFMLECQSRYIVRCLDELARRGARWLDVQPAAMAHSNVALQRALARTAWAADCHNWYKTADGKLTNNWSGRTTRYWWRTRRPDFDQFEIAP